MLTPPALIVPESDAPQARTRLTPRLVLIDVDAARRDFASNPAIMPNLVALAQSGASGTAQVPGVSMSLPAIKAWTTGEPFTARDIVADFWGIDPHSESVFHHAKRQGLKVYFSGPPEWVRSFEPSFAGYYTHHNAGGNTAENDRQAQINALRFAHSDFDVLVVHYINADMQGHNHGTVGPNAPYANALRQIDAYIGELLRTVPQPCTFLVMGDHGMTDEGFHWDAAPSVIYPPFVIGGSGIRSTSALALNQVDVAPIVSVLLGTSFPSHSEGILPEQMLQGTARDQAVREFEYAKVRQRTIAAANISNPSAASFLTSGEAAFKAGDYTGSVALFRNSQAACTSSLHQQGRTRALLLLLLGLAVVGAAVVWVAMKIRLRDRVALSAAVLSTSRSAMLVLAVAAALAWAFAAQSGDRQFWPFRYENLRHLWQLSLVCVFGTFLAVVFRRITLPRLNSAWTACLFALLGVAMASTHQLHDALHWSFCAALAFAATRVFLDPPDGRKLHRFLLVSSYGALLFGSLLARRAVRAGQYFRVDFGQAAKLGWFVLTVALVACCVAQFVRKRDKPFSLSLTRLPLSAKCLLVLFVFSLAARLNLWVPLAVPLMLLIVLCVAIAWATTRKNQSDRWTLCLSIALVAAIPLVYPLPYAALAVLELLVLMQMDKSLADNTPSESMLALFIVAGNLFLLFAFGGDFVVRTVDDKRALLLDSSFSLNYLSVLRIAALQLIQLLAPCALFLLWLRRGLRRSSEKWHGAIVLAQLAMMVGLAVSAINLQFLNRTSNSLLENLSSLLIGYVLYLVLAFAYCLASTSSSSADFVQPTFRVQSSSNSEQSWPKVQ
jgi:hypothetical protein